jgi:[ribosomal protein S5]-alanine N-acetyltransferase
MSDAIVLETPRLRLIAGDARIERAAGTGREALAAVLDVEVARDWPPPLSEDAQGYWASALERTPSLRGWATWYWLLMRAGDAPLLCGIGGFKGAPVEGTVEIGYSLVESQHRRGLAPEACEALIAWASRDARVHRVIAHTLPELRPSIRVLEKLGFALVGPGEEPGSILYELPLG